MKYLIIIQLLFMGLAVNAQDTTVCPCQKEVSEAFVSNLKGQIYHGMPTLVGSEFYNESYSSGDIMLEGGEVVKDQQIRYNGRIDGILLLPPKSALEILLNTYFLKGFCLKNSKGNYDHCFTKLKVIKEFGSDSSLIYGEILYQNKLSLYAYRRYAFDKEVIVDMANTKIAQSVFGPSFIYYFKLPNGRTIGFKKFRKRNLYQLFPGNKELMRQLFKEKHQRRFSDEQDLIRIAEILNLMYK